MKDKSKELTATIKLVNDRLHFEGTVEGNKPVSIDYIPPLGDNLGYTSLELILLSLSSCVGTAILAMLRKQGKTILEFSIKSEGTRRQTHPTSLEIIHLYVDVKATELTSEEMDKTLAIIKGVCPVWDMIQERTNVIIHYSIIK